MTTQRLPGTGKRVLSPVVLGCLWAFALPADARAQNPGFTAANCNVQSGVMNGAVYWQIQGTATVSNLPMGMTTVNVKV